MKAEKKFPTGIWFVTTAHLKKGEILLPACALIKSQKKFFPEENAKHSSAADMILAEKAMIAATAEIAETAETIAVPVAVNAPAAADAIIDY